MPPRAYFRVHSRTTEPSAYLVSKTDGRKVTGVRLPPQAPQPHPLQALEQPASGHA